MTSATAQGDMMTATINDQRDIIKGRDKTIVEILGTVEKLQAENDALKVKVFIIHSAAKFVVDADDEEGRKYHLEGLERALNLNQNECLAQEQDA